MASVGVAAGRSSYQLIVGLGNPGPEYAATRHNIGFWALARLAARAGAALRPGLLGRFTETVLAEQPVILLEPHTYMNASGRAVRAACDRYSIEIDSVIVLHDELDLPPGGLRLKQGGGDAGHRGLKSIRAELGGGDFIRVRLGIGRPSDEFVGAVVDFVLEGLAPAEEPAFADLAETGADAVEALLAEGLEKSMNRFNARR